MDERNFRFYDFGRENSSNSLFYDDVFLLLNQRRLNPTISILISIENEQDLVANGFWSDNRIIQLLVNSGSKAIRIKRESQQNEYQQFTELFHVQSFPSLYVFGPSSSGPSFVYSSTYPDYQRFASDFSTLTYSPAPVFQPPQPQQEQPPQQAPQQPPEQTSRSQSPQPEQQEQPSNPQPQPSKSTPSNQTPKGQQIPEQKTVQEKPPQNIPNEDEYVRRRTKPQQQQQQQPKKQLPEIPIEVTATTPDKKVHTNTFKSSDNCLTIRIWISKLIGKPHTTYKLIVIPGEFILPLSDKVFLRQYAPKLNLRVELIGANNQPAKSQSKIMRYISNFLSNISIFADPEDDPSDFWRKEPVYRRSNERRPQ